MRDVGGDLEVGGQMEDRMERGVLRGVPIVIFQSRCQCRTWSIQKNDQKLEGRYVWTNGKDHQGLQDVPGLVALVILSLPPLRNSRRGRPGRRGERRHEELKGV